jgi:hypothetical protein
MAKEFKNNDIWMKEPADIDFVTPFGSLYPVQVICTVYETNRLGERRLVEQKTFNLVEAN